MIWRGVYVPSSSKVPMGRLGGSEVGGVGQQEVCFRTRDGSESDRDAPTRRRDRRAKG